MNKDLLSDELITKVLDLRRKKKSTSAYIMQKCNCTKEEARQLIASIDKGIEPNEQEVETSLDNIANKNILKFGDYTYNQLTDKYIVPLTTYGRDFVCPGDQHRAMLTAYSNWKGSEQSIQEIGRVYKMRKEWVREYFQKMGWTHDTVPITDEELVQNKGHEAIKRVLQTKRTAIQQELQHQDWKQTQDDAEQWRLFEAGKLTPFERALANFNPKPLPKLKFKSDKPEKDEIFLIGLSDLHFGGLANSEELFSGESFDSEVIKQIVDNYAAKVQEFTQGLKYTFKKAAICSLGDILHTLTGMTVKGTILEADVLREEQFELALNSLIQFISRMLEIFPEIEVHAVKGNHAGAGDYILFKAIALYFRLNPQIKFNLYKSRQACFRVGSVAILMDHGASDISKSSIPTTGSAKESYIQSLFLQFPEVLTGAKCRLMLQGDRHRFMYEELKGFEHVIMGSCVLGDRYADNLGLHSRARQNCLILSKDGIKQVLSFYFD